jgi:hypothetical protein
MGIIFGKIIPDLGCDASNRQAMTRWYNKNTDS